MVSPSKLAANPPSGLVYVAQALGGSSWAKVMAFGLALSVIATTGVGIVLGARVIYGMASHRVLPPFLGNVNQRFSTPVAASLVVGVIILGGTWAYLLSTSLANAFNDAIAVTALLYAAFYILTALAAIVYLLWAARLQQRHRRADHRRAPAGRRRLPRLALCQVDTGLHRAADLVAGRDHRRRGDLDADRALLVAI